ncbi:hypothetical protein CLV24_13433 [Pontibacter ummariensis]|uniref:Uncharacterized protein n=1 Tax=Pontibacter ummariensis TaxID=1610492 RepID=A0A239KZY5_9BACT|nr:hypothetical protein [Pontibacter ummariensis]PRY04627.1 hypothetical protein CLV24_13433 [Pontibacter ummariensis]SNT23897.1 hypothetical protein SAMN06296052_13410 [Pontibacter ummariensis]
MSKRSHFWILFIASVIISGLIITVFVKALKVVLMVILVLALAPIIYFLLRLLVPKGRKDDADKLDSGE